MNDKEANDCSDQHLSECIDLVVVLTGVDVVVVLTGVDVVVVLTGVDVVVVLPTFCLIPDMYR